MIKCCGLMRMADIDIINCARPDYAGFVLAPSKRQIKDPWQLKKMIQHLRKDIKPVGVFVNPSLEVLKESVACGIQVIQFHGDESLETVSGFKKHLEEIEFWKAYRFGNTEKSVDHQMTEIELWLNAHFIQEVLVDRYDLRHYGGTGDTLQWSAFNDSGLQSRLILAGGLTVSNVSQAIRTFKPKGIDVSSGIEKDGVKSFKLTQGFVCKARAEFYGIRIKNI